MPEDNIAAKIRALEKRRDWDLNLCRPAERATGGVAIACLSVKCHEEKDEKSGHAGM